LVQFAESCISATFVSGETVSQANQFSAVQTRVAAAVQAALRSRKHAAAAAISVSCMLSAPAFAQNAEGAQAKDSEEVTEVIVTGIRRQLETSQLRKQEATELVDAVTAEDIGSLPDRSVCPWPVAMSVVLTRSFMRRLLDDTAERPDRSILEPVVPAVP
jgi:hypothetical protein